MQMTEVIRKVGRNDARIIGRDSFLLTLMGYAVGMLIIMRLVLPPIATALLENAAFDLVPYYPLLVSALVLHQVAAVLAGTIMGFLLIDERDHKTITALLVTPVPPHKYVLYRVMIPMVVGFMLSVAGLLLLGNVVTVAWWQVMLLSAINALFAALISLFLATFSGNKVEGFATIKIVGSLLLIIMGAWFIPEPWQFIAGIYPPYWTMKALWSIEAGANITTWLTYLALASVTHLMALAYLVRRFTIAIYNDV